MGERRRSVPAALAALLSLLLPGLGHVVLGQVRRGLLMLGSVATIVFIADWRFRLLAPQAQAAGEAWAAALARRPFFVGVVTLATAAIWLWAAWDAWRKARSGGAVEPRGHVFIFVLILAVFFALGWQISRIDMVQMIVDFPEAWPPLSKVIWPWKAAVTRETTKIVAGASILSPCDDNAPPPAPVETPGEPYLAATPTCGELARFDENNRQAPGTLMSVEGRGFRPNTATELWWVDPQRNEFRIRKAGQYLVVDTDDRGGFSLEINMPYSMMPPSSRGRQIHRIEARQISAVGGLKAAEALLLVISRMVETIFMGMMATVFGILFSIPVSFMAARNLMAHSRLTLALYYVTRTVLNIVRAIEPLIWALVAVVWVGLGPFAGIIALTVHSIASLAKLYSEAIESIDPGPIEAIQATGATRLQTIAYAVVPQMIPPFVSFSIYRWDINVRMSTIIGLVGGGGVGFILVQYIRLLDYRSAGIAVWFIAITVATLDYVSSEIRQRFV